MTENWKLLCIFFVLLGVILVVALVIYPLDYKDESVTDDLDFFDFSDLDSSTDPDTPEFRFTASGKRNFAGLIVVCGVVLAMVTLYDRNKKS